MAGGDADATIISEFTRPCCVFWDVADCPFPNGLSPASIYKNMKSSLEKMGIHGAFSIKAYVDEEKLADESVDRDYKDAGITIVRRQGEGDSESARNYSIVVDMALWVYDQGTDSFDRLNVIVISKSIAKDEDILYQFSKYRNARYDVQVPSCHDPNFKWLFKTLVEKKPTIAGGDAEISESTRPSCVFWNPFLDGLSPVSIYKPTMAGEIQQKCRKPDYLADFPFPALIYEPTMAGGNADDSGISEFIRPCCVFWDVADFPFPNGLRPALIYKNMKSCLEEMGILGDLTIKAYVDEDKFADQLVDDDYKDAGITIVRRQGEGESESARNYSIVVDIALWALENPANYYEPLDLMVISKRIKDKTYFLSVLEALKERYYNVLLALPHHLSSSWLHTVSFQWLSSSLVDGENPTDDQSQTFQDRCHKQKSKSEDIVTFSELLPYTFKGDISRSDIAVFWDVGFPSSSPFSYLRESRDEFDSLRETALIPNGYHGDLSISAYVEKGYVQSEFHRWDHEFLVILLPEGDEYAKVTRMLLDVLFWAMNSEPGILILLSPALTALTDTNCVIKALKAKGFEVMLAPSIKQLTISKCPEILTEPVFFIVLVSHLVLVLDLEDWKGIEPEILYVGMLHALDRKGYGNDVEIMLYSGARFKDVYSVRKSELHMDSYSAAGFQVRYVGSTPKVPLMIADTILSSRHSAVSTYVIISKPFKDQISNKVFAGVVKELKDKEINVFFGLPDVSWITFGSSMWSFKTILDFLPRLRDDMEIEGS